MTAPLYDRRLTLRWPLPDVLTTTIANTFRAPAYLSGSIVPAVSGTFAMYDESGTERVAPVAGVVDADGVLSHTVLVGAFASVRPQVGWRVDWTVVTASGSVSSSNELVVTKTDLYPVISDTDLYRRVDALDPSKPTSITTVQTQQPKIDESWTMLMGRMIEVGLRSQWVKSPSSMREVHITLALTLIYEDLASRLDPAYGDRAKELRTQYERAWTRLTVLKDTDGDGLADSRRSGVKPQSLWLGGRR